MKNKFKNYSFWVALSGAVIIFVEAIGKICGFTTDGDMINNVIMGFAGVLVVFGVVTSPTENIGNEDSEEEKKDDEKDDEKH